MVKLKFNGALYLTLFSSEKFANQNEGVNTLTNPPHHLQRYTEICTKNARDVTILLH